MASDDEFDSVDAQEVEERQEPEEEQGETENNTPSWLWNKRPWDAFKTFAIIFSFILNFVLLLVLLIVGGLIIPIVNDIVEPIVGGLNDSFVDMSEATIEQEIDINTTMPISFTLPLEQETIVTLTEPVPLSVFAQFTLPGGGGNINGQVNLTLPEGLELPVFIDTDVAVDQEIPVQMTVPVKIPLAETELGGPFFTLRALFEPLNELLTNLPSSNEELTARLADEVLGTAPAPVPTEPAPQPQ